MQFFIVFYRVRIIQGKSEIHCYLKVLKQAAKRLVGRHVNLNSPKVNSTCYCSRSVSKLDEYPMQRMWLKLSSSIWSCLFLRGPE